MSRRSELLQVEWHEHIPHRLDDGVLYVSMEFATAIHRCMCGCGSELVTPFSRRGWRLAYDGHGVTLSPSIEAAARPCRSHYFIRDSRVVWVHDWETRSRGRRTPWWRRIFNSE
jgi:hypothetical protein